MNPFQQYIHTVQSIRLGMEAVYAKGLPNEPRPEPRPILISTLPAWAREEILADLFRPIDEGR